MKAIRLSPGDNKRAPVVFDLSTEIISAPLHPLYHHLYPLLFTYTPTMSWQGIALGYHIFDIA